MPALGSFCEQSWIKLQTVKVGYKPTYAAVIPNPREMCVKFSQNVPQLAPRAGKTKKGGSGANFATSGSARRGAVGGALRL